MKAFFRAFKEFIHAALSIIAALARLRGDGALDPEMTYCLDVAAGINEMLEALDLSVNFGKPQYGLSAGMDTFPIGRDDSPAIINAQLHESHLDRRPRTGTGKPSQGEGSSQAEGRR